MRHILTLAALGAASLASAQPAIAQRAPAAVIVVVDSDRIYRECNACRTAQAQLQSRVTQLQTRQQTLGNQLRPEGLALQNALKALGGKEPDAAMRTRLQAFQTKQEQANAELAKSQQDIQAIQASVVRQINERLGPVVNQVMVARGANLAVDVETTLAHAQGVNVTADVLARLNAALPALNLAVPVQQAPKSR